MEDIVKENIAKIQELLGRITQEKWAWGQSTTITREDNIVWFTTALDANNEGAGKLQLVITEDEEKTICIVGNGPTSEANAQFISSAPDIIRFMFSLISQAQEENTRLRAVLTQIEEGATGNAGNCMDCDTIAQLVRQAL